MKLILLLVLGFGTTWGYSQVAWDDTRIQHKPSWLEKVNIKSTHDGSTQPAMVYKATGNAPRPLLVSLHTWSGDYLQNDSLAALAKERNWNYIHPNFRGANNHIMACGSAAAVQDIADAIHWALGALQADSNEVHITGTSGGGYMAMVCYMQLAYPVKSFHAWVGISDLEAWYYQSLGRGQKYAEDIWKCTGSSNVFNVAEARVRSPLYMPVPKRSGTLHLYAGVHDGYKGSVPITHSLLFYNKIANGVMGATADTISHQEMLQLTTQRNALPAQPDMVLGGRPVHLFRQSGNVSIYVFEGGHESIVTAVLPLIAGAGKGIRPVRLLTLGDSNGAAADGWVAQLQKSMPWAQIMNFSRGGRTIGFDNNGDTTLNGLRMLSSFMDSMQRGWLQGPDAVVVCLGTNDAKAVFAKQQKQVRTNFKQLHQQVHNTLGIYPAPVPIIWIAPPPIGNVANNAEKYKNAATRLKDYAQWMPSMLNKPNDFFINPQPQLLDIDALAPDGIHMGAEGQLRLAEMILSQLYQVLK